VPLLGYSFGPILSSLFSIPLIIWYPMLVIWVGIGPSSKIIFALICGVFPIALNVLTATELVDRRFLEAAKSFGASGPTLLWRVLMPLALPGIIAGLRIGTGLVVVGVIVGEMLVSLGGIGYWISLHRTTFDTPEVYAGIIVVLVFVLGIDFLMLRLEHIWSAPHQR
jgi:NitT/TauT family transport system permease protein/taurine transport system permease protein